MDNIDFHDREYRNEFARSFLGSTVATQIKALREARGLSQAALAQRAGMRQSRISAMEDVNYSSWSIRTLQRLAEALDVALVVRFESFGVVRGQALTIDRAALLRPSFVDDPVFKTVTPIATTNVVFNGAVDATADAAHGVADDTRRVRPASRRIIRSRPGVVASYRVQPVTGASTNG